MQTAVSEPERAQKNFDSFRHMTPSAIEALDIYRPIYHIRKYPGDGCK